MFNNDESDRVTFTTSSSAAHVDDSVVTNLSNLFLTEFFRKYKELYVPGLQDRSFVTGLDQSLFAKQAKDLYTTKGTDDSFEILFRALYGSKATIVKPYENTIKPSDADYRITEDLVVVALSGDPYKLLDKHYIRMQFLAFLTIHMVQLLTLSHIIEKEILYIK